MTELPLRRHFDLVIRVAVTYAVRSRPKRSADEHGSLVSLLPWNVAR